MKQPFGDAPQPREFNEEENKAIIPIFKEDEESDDEEERIRLYLQADFDEALDAEWSPAKIPPDDDDIPDLDELGTLEDSRPDVIHNPHDVDPEKEKSAEERQEEQVLAEQIAKEGPPPTEEGTEFKRPDVPVVTTVADEDSGTRGRSSSTGHRDGREDGRGRD